MARKDVKFDITAQDKTKAAFEAAERHVKGLSATVGRFKGAIGAAFAVAGVAALVKFTKEAITAADAIGKVADRIGIGTDALQKYRYALEISGVAQEQTDRGLEKFVRNMGELGRSSSETQTALRDLDPALLANLRTMGSIEEQLDATFEALAGYSSEAQRAAVASATFGRTGGRMIVGIKDGIDAFRDLQAEAERLGFVLSDRMVRAAEAANDQLTRMERVLSTNLTRLLIGLAPTIIRLGNAAAEAAPKIKAFIDGFLPDSLKGADSLRAELDEILALIGKLTELENEYQNKSALGKAPFFVDHLARESILEDLEARAEELRQLIKLAQESEDAVRAGLEGSGTTSTLNNQKDALESYMDSLRKQVTLAQYDERARRRVVAVMRAQEAAQREGKKLTEEQTDEIRKNIDTLEVWEQHWREVEDTERDAQRQADETNRRIAEGTEAAFDVASRAIENWARTGKFSFRDFAADAIRMIGDIVKAWATAQVTSSAGGGLGGILGGIFGGLGGIFGGGVTPDFGGSFFAASSIGAPATSFAAMPAIPLAKGGVMTSRGLMPLNRYAGGGVARTPQLAMFGEGDGAEAYVPLPDGRSIPVTMKGGGGGVTNVFQIDARGAEVGVEERIKAVLLEMMPDITEASLGRVLQHRRENPTAFLAA